MVSRMRKELMCFASRGFDLTGHFERGAFILNIMTMSALRARHSRVGGHRDRPLKRVL
jgi:hypothetical protein